jgi:hypothetical protein
MCDRGSAVADMAVHKYIRNSLELKKVAKTIKSRPIDLYSVYITTL